MDRRLDRLKIPVVAKVIEAYQRWQSDGGNLLAAAVAYYASLSLFPLLLVLISAMGFALRFTDWGQDAEEQVLQAIAEYASPAVRAQVSKMLEGVQQNAAVGGPVGIAVLLLTAGALFVYFEQAFDRIWNIEAPQNPGIVNTLRNLLFHRLRAFLMLLALVLLILVVLVANVTLAALQSYMQGSLPGEAWVWWFVQVASSITLTAGAFTLLYRLLPKVQVRWLEALQGGVFAAVVWEIGRLILTVWLTGNKYSAYGLVGSFLAVMLWMYYAGVVTFLGAEYVQVICQRCDGEKRGAASGRKRNEA